MTEMGAKGRKKSITKKLKKGANEFSALSASKDKAADFLVCLWHIKVSEALQCSRRSWKERNVENNFVWHVL